MSGHPICEWKVTSHIKPPDLKRKSGLAYQAWRKSGLTYQVTPSDKEKWPDISGYPFWQGKVAWHIRSPHLTRKSGLTYQVTPSDKEKWPDISGLPIWQGKVAWYIRSPLLKRKSGLSYQTTPPEMEKWPVISGRIHVLWQYSLSWQWPDNEVWL